MTGIRVLSAQEMLLVEGGGAKSFFQGVGRFFKRFWSGLKESQFNVGHGLYRGIYG